jgi:GR25 family glycosyltransferase involved in LPS biosynthesis
MKGYLINLKKRIDRLERFQNEVGNSLPDINIEVVEAIDGRLLDLTDVKLRNDVTAWNFKHLSEKLLRGVIGCCLSHLKCYELIGNNDDKYAIIFEDDCWFKSEKQKKMANDFIKQLNIPEKFGIIFLNKWEVKRIKRVDKDYDLITGAPTAESYIISKEYAKILYDENIHNIGAIDTHMGLLISKYPEYPSYQLVNELFIQYDRTDSNIR